MKQQCIFRLFTLGLLLGVITHNASAAQTLSGMPAAAADSTFVSPINLFEASYLHDEVFMASATAGNGEYALSFANRVTNSVHSLAAHLVKLNGVEESVNPLYNAAFSHLALLTRSVYPAAVLDGQPTNVYVVLANMRASDSDVVAAYDIKDAQDVIGGAVTAGIVALEGGDATVFAAVKKNGGSFGDIGGGVALLQLQETSTIIYQVGLVQLDAQPTPTTVDPNITRASSLDKTSPSLLIGASPLATVQQVVDMHWDKELQRLYVALQITTGASGGRSLVVGRIQETIQDGKVVAKKLIFEPFAPDTAFDATENGIIGCAAAASLSAHKVCTMRTSSSLKYAIVLGGNGAPAATKQTVYALPLVDNSTLVSTPTTQATHGTLAAKSATPQETFNATNHLFKARSFLTTATTTADLTRSTDEAALVGGGQLPAMATALFASSDTVFALVPDNCAAPLVALGLYASQALFNEQGAIRAWTPWRRSLTAFDDNGSVQRMSAAALDPARGTFTMLVGNDAVTTTTVKRTEWGLGDANGSAQLTTCITDALPQDIAGVQGMVTFDARTTPALLHSVSWLVTTGFNTVAIAQLEANVAGNYVPTTTNFAANKQTYTTGAITAPIPSTTRILTISGGVLSDIGPVTTAAVGADTTSSSPVGYLFVGGAKGLAVLGDGFDVPMTSGFGGFASGDAFTLVGTYSFVRKLVAVDQYMYVLTTQYLDRLDLSSPMFTATRLADVAQLPNHTEQDTLFDVLVSEEFIMLGTSQGLMRVANGQNVAAATGLLSWQRVTVPEAVGPVTKLAALTTTGKETDLLSGAVSNVLVLSAYSGGNTAQINRFVISSDTEEFIITDSLLQPLRDLFVQDVLSYFVSFGTLRQQIATDGALLISGVNRNLANAPFAQLLAPPLKSGMPFGMTRFAHQLALNITTDNTVVSILASPAVGSWMLAGDFGMRVAE